MTFRLPRDLGLGLIAAATMTLIFVWPAATSAQAATCPTVDPTTHAVTPAPAPGVDWSGCDLTGANLSFASLTGANLSGATLANTNLLQANLTQGNLSSVDFSGASAILANLQQANIAGAVFATTVLTGLKGSDVTGKPASLPAHWFVATATDASHTTHHYLIGPTANVPGAGLFGVDLSGRDLEQLNISNGSLANTRLANTDLAGANFSGLQSGGVTGAPSALPANWFTQQGYLLGPGADAAGANMAGQDLTSRDLQGINFEEANFTGADLVGLNLDSVNFLQADFTDANLAGANLNADLQQANLTGANLTGATIASANLSGVTWLHTTCPDGSNSDQYVDGCLSALDTTAPAASPQVTSGTAGNNGWYTSKVTVDWEWADDGTIVAADCPASTTTTGEGHPVTLQASCTDLAGNVGHASYQVNVDTVAPSVAVTGVSAGHVYVLGAVPQAACQTTDDLSGVARPATVKITTTGSGGVGPFTASCSGASDVAGNGQAGTVRAAYTVGYGFGGFVAPSSGTTLSKSARVIGVKFRLTNAAGQPISAAAAAAFGKAGKVRATMTGPGISRQTATCAWKATPKLYLCEISIPAGARTGAANSYAISAWEKLGSGFIQTPVTGKALNPVIVHFR